MTDLRSEVRRMTIPEDAVSLDEGVKDEAWVLQNMRSEWAVFYSERGGRTGERRFLTEQEACADLLQRLRRAFGRSSSDERQVTRLRVPSR